MKTIKTNLIFAAVLLISVAASAQAPNGLDSDADGVMNFLDKCPATPANTVVDALGCFPDADSDGVTDSADKCPGTPGRTAVDTVGCAVFADSDGDGVADSLDKCPGTPVRIVVDAAGCFPDADSDGITDFLDKCPGTPRGTVVDTVGCAVAGTQTAPPSTPKEAAPALPGYAPAADVVAVAAPPATPKASAAALPGYAPAVDAVAVAAPPATPKASAAALPGYAPAVDAVAVAAPPAMPKASAAAAPDNTPAANVVAESPAAPSGAAKGTEVIVPGYAQAADVVVVAALPDAPKPAAAAVPGIAPDTDGDTIPDPLDKCPGTPKAISVDTAGCPSGSPVEIRAMERLSLVAAPGSITPLVVAAVRGAAGDPSCPWYQVGKMCQLVIEFDYDKAEIKSGFAAQLKEIAAFMSANPEAKIELQGHTDDRGSVAYNLNLSRNRAGIVKKHFVKTGGLDAGRLSVRGIGKSKPIASNETEEGRAENRRVIAVLSFTSTR